MVQISRLKRKLGWLELGLYLAGLAMIGVFFLVRGENERLRQEGIEAFHAATAQAAVQPEGVSGPGAAASQVDDYSGFVPDLALWDEARVRQYEASLAQPGGPPLAILSIAQLGVRVPVYNGTDESNLKRGVGRIEGTAWVETDGNLGIAGHRDSFFRPLKDIRVGDTIDLETAGETVTYAVSSIEIVDPGDVWVLSPTEKKTLTLVTCYPFYYVGHAPKRYIVKAFAEHSVAKT